MRRRSGPRLGDGVATQPLPVERCSLLKKNILEITRAANGKHAFYSHSMSNVFPLLSSLNILIILLS